MSRPLGPYQERRMHSESDEVRSTPRKREYVWAGLAGILAAVLAVGPLDFEAAQVTESIVEEEGARVAEQAGKAIADRHSADPRDLERGLSSPRRCLEPYEQWIVQWGDGRLPRERQADGRPGTRCTHADLRRRRGP